MRIDPRGEARRLLAQVDPADLDVLATDPVTALGVLFDITITTRPPSLPGPGCPVDGTYRPGPPPHIFVADDVTAARQRFTVLHEWGHHLIEHDDYLNDLEISDAERSDENICNEVAATVLLPDDIVDKTLPAGVFTAEHVAALFDNVSASRCRRCSTSRRCRPDGVLRGRRPSARLAWLRHPRHRRRNRRVHCPPPGHPLADRPGDVPGPRLPARQGRQVQFGQGPRGHQGKIRHRHQQRPSPWGRFRGR